jgi:PTH1 family peptidyl-tRNA hydrolase
VNHFQLIAGLGNPGGKYASTRHNAGFMVLDELAARHDLKFRKAGRLEGALLGNTRLVKPQAFMNLSGGVIQGAITRGCVRPQQLLVIHDDLDLPLGRLRLRSGGSSGGQRGVQDTIRAIGPDFWRLKVGISGTPAGWETANWVLSRFQPGEGALLAGVISAAADAVELALQEGPEAAANRFNGLDLRAAADGNTAG